VEGKYRSFRFPGNRATLAIFKIFFARCKNFEECAPQQLEQSDFTGKLAKVGIFSQ
jgi:hypothetical protein